MDFVKQRVKTVRPSFLSKKINNFLARDIGLAINSNYEKKIIEELKGRAYPVGYFSYHFKRENDLFDLALKAIFKADSLGKDIISGTLWAADELSKAKGRFDRVWYAPLGGAYFVLALYPNLERSYWSLYSLAAGVAIAQVLREWGCRAGIRWINDVMVNDKKIAGILTKTYQSPLSKQSYILLGIGINVNTDFFPDSLPEATSLYLETGKKWPIWDLTSHIIARLGWLIALTEQWEAQLFKRLEGEKAPPNPLIYAWERCNFTLNRKIVFGYNLDISPELTGIAHSLELDGSLNVLLDSGNLINLNSGEIRFL